MIPVQLKELLLQSLEHERGGVLVYQTALECVINDDLRSEWEKYLAQTEKHVVALTTVCESLGLDPGEMTPGCKVVAHLGTSLVVAMKMALASGDPAGAELVACDCVVLAETKDHANWQLIGECTKAFNGDVGLAMRSTYEEIEAEEDEHLYHSMGWARELWLQSLAISAVLPPPEEERDVKTAAEASDAVRELTKERGLAARPSS